MPAAGTATRPAVAHDGQLHLDFGQQLPVGNMTTTVAFSYPLSKGLLGFYQSEYKTAKGDTKQLAATMFESMSARKALPCMDEPALKVLSLHCISNLMAMMFITCGVC